MFSTAEFIESRSILYKMKIVEVLLLWTIIACPNVNANKSLELEGFKSLDELKQQLEQQSNPETITNLSIEHSSLGTLELKLLERFTSLQELSFSYNEIQQIGNDDFYGLQNLETLTLRDNGMEQLENQAFRGLDKLETLDLSNNLITQLNEDLFKRLKNLKLLRLANNLINHLDKDVLNHIYFNKITLELNNNRLEVLPRGLLTNITGADLIFSDNSIINIEDGAFEGSSCLSLQLESNELTTISPEGFKNFNVYNELRLSKNKINLQPQNFKYLSNLLRLFLDQNEISSIPSKCFQGLDQTNTLSLRDNKITNIESDGFSGLGNLKTLFLGVNPIKTLSQDTFKHVPTIAFLHLDHCHLNTVDPAVFQNLYQLSVFNLGKNKLTYLPNELLYQHLKSLKNVYLDNNNIKKITTGAFVTPGRKLVFQFLLLKCNQISEIDPGAFEGVETVYSLQLQQNNIKRLNKDSFKYLTHVKTLNLEDNFIEDVHDLKALPPARLVLLGGNKLLERTDLPLNELGIQHVDFISFKNYSYHRTETGWEFVDKPAEQ